MILRHKPETVGVVLDKSGWIDIDILLSAIKSSGNSGWSRELLEEIVRDNDKKRFSISEDGKQIRANQGHSVKVNLDYEPTEPPSKLFHGTVKKFVDSIKVNGLQKMKRHHVHLSADVGTAKQVGSRRGSPVIFVVDATRMYKDGYEFYISDNGVWLTDHVPFKYLEFVW